MVYCISDNIFSPLGKTSEENYRSVKAGLTAVRRHDTRLGMPEPFMASLFEEGFIEKAFAETGLDGAGLSVFEKLAALSIDAAIKHCKSDLSIDDDTKHCKSGSSLDGTASHRKVDFTGPDTIFILSSTKGNVGLLERTRDEEEIVIPASARRLARLFGFQGTPIVVSNACISGVSALITAKRLLECGAYRNAVVCGCDELSRFIVSGFNSFKALSDEVCKPFDAERKGLNLGEAAATMILSVDQPCDSPSLAAPSCPGQPANNPNGGRFCADKALADKALTSKYAWTLAEGAIRNDANHISGPSRTGEGSFRALEAVLSGHEKENIAFINAHGTATPYNDDMESWAITRAGLENVPVNALKAHFGHTLGAAGILETVMSMKAVDDGTILPAKGCDKPGTVKQINVNTETRQTGKKSFIKLLSGFGGCNAALLMEKVGLTSGPETVSNNGILSDKHSQIFDNKTNTDNLGHTATLHEERGQAPEQEAAAAIPEPAENAVHPVSGCEVTVLPSGSGDTLLDLYKSLGCDYPKFHKMDGLSKLGFIAAELLMSKAEEKGIYLSDKDNCAMIFAGRLGSLATDIRHDETIRPEEFYPSPAVFVYTLANVVSGEIAIRHKMYGESTSFLLDKDDEAIMETLVRQAFTGKSKPEYVMGGWLDFRDKEDFAARLKLYSENHEQL